MSLSTDSLRIFKEPARFRRPADFEEFEAKPVEADQDALQRCLIGDSSSQHSLRWLHCGALEVFELLQLVGRDPAPDVNLVRSRWHGENLQSDPESSRVTIHQAFGITPIGYSAPHPRVAAAVGRRFRFTQLLGDAVGLHGQCSVADGDRGHDDEAGGMALWFSRCPLPPPPGIGTIAAPGIHESTRCWNNELSEWAASHTASIASNRPDLMAPTNCS